MNQPNTSPVGVPGAARREAPTPGQGRPGVENGPPGFVHQSAETERLLAGVESDLELVDQKSTQDQVPVFDRIHTALADALARTADTGGGSPAGGQQGA